MKRLEEMFWEWHKEYDDDKGVPFDFPLLRSRIKFLSNELYCQYLPTKFSDPNFEKRLYNWICNVEDTSARQTLSKLVPYIFFVGTDEIDSLCKQAFSEKITAWYQKLHELPLPMEPVDGHFAGFIHETWFCPVTDSFPIAQFCHLNNMSGQRFRPDWRSLTKLGSSENIRKHMNDGPIKLNRLVLLEDFVGTGNQSKQAIEFACRDTLPDKPVLFCPLVISYVGHELMLQLQSSYENLTYLPCLILSKDSCILESKQALEEEFFEDLRCVMDNAHSKLGDFQYPKLENNAYGFGGNGCLIVLYSNCPNNTIPIIHKSSDDWSPLFKRVSRQ